MREKEGWVSLFFEFKGILLQFYRIKLNVLDVL